MKSFFQAIVILFVGAFAAIVAPVNVSFASANEMTTQEVIELANADRASLGLPELTSNEKLTQAAQDKANDMASNQYFAHTSPEGTTPWYWMQENGYKYRFAGENLAIHFSNAQDQESAWMGSVKHRENILNPKYAEIGVAVLKTEWEGFPTTITVQMFGLASGAAIPNVAVAKPSLQSHSGMVSGVERGFEKDIAGQYDASAEKVKEDSIKDAKLVESSKKVTMEVIDNEVSLLGYEEMFWMRLVGSVASLALLAIAIGCEWLYYHPSTNTKHRFV